MEVVFCLFILIVLSKSALQQQQQQQQQQNESTDCTCNFTSEGNGTVRTLTITCGIPIEEEIKQCFDKYNNATDLILTNSSLTAIPKDLNILKQLSMANFSNNIITKLDFQNNKHVCQNIKKLVLDFNRIRVLNKGNLDCFTSLEHIYMANNTLSTIKNGTFNSNLKNLIRIHFMYNELTAIDSSLLYLPQLKEKNEVRLNVSWNKLNIVTNSINLSIKDFEPWHPFFIAVIHNNFTKIDIHYLFKIFHVTNYTQLYRLYGSGFDLRFNPLVCDCQMYPLAVKLREFRHMDPNNPVFSLTCYEPYPLRGMLVYEVPDNQFNCTITSKCPRACSCTETVVVGLITVRCFEDYALDTLPESIPISPIINLNIKTDKLHIVSRQDYMVNVTMLDVSQCGVNVMQADIISQIDDVTKVYFHDNALQILPQEIQNLNFKKLHELTLHGNPFTCDCHTLWLKQWLLKNKTLVPHHEKILCGSGHGKGQILVNVDDDDFVCTATLSTNEIIIIVAGSILFIIILIIIVHQNTIRIQVLFIAYFNIYCFRKTVQTELKYDIFVSHSSLDDGVIYDKIIPKLESNDPPFQMCIDVRNFGLGKTIVNEIILAIESSLTTLLIISNSFLRSNWCLMEFREAHLRFMKDKTANIIIIVLEDLDNSLIDDELKRFMRDHIYLKYTDRYFWPKLLNALPVRAKLGTDSERAQSSTESIRVRSNPVTTLANPSTGPPEDNLSSETSPLLFSE